MPPAPTHNPSKPGVGNGVGKHGTPKPVGDKGKKGPKK